ncbi:MAG: hypothetical protein V2A78_07700 [bacterium]
MSEEVEIIMEPEDKSYLDVPFEKLLGVALLGALGSVILFYVYQQLGEDMRRNVRENVISAVKAQLAKLSQ